MGEILSPKPVMLIMAAFSADAEALKWARQRGSETWGQPVLESQEFVFDQTSYYEAEMGADLRKVFWAFSKPIDASQLIDIKHLTNSWEQELANDSAMSAARPVNLDPGVLTEAKLVLATTKDRDHRIYLGRGIFAEVTLYYRRGEWRSREWTYADYQRAEYHQFFQQCRDYLRQLNHRSDATSSDHRSGGHAL